MPVSILVGRIGAALLAGALFFGIHVLVRIPAIDRPTLGGRGDKRRRALNDQGAFALVEPFVRRVAGWVKLLPLQRYRDWMDSKLLQAGDLLGLCADEFAALSLFSLAFFVGLGVLGACTLDVGWLPLVVATLVGGVVPYLAVQAEILRRQREVSRALPAAIDTISMCLMAGLDFPGSVRQVVSVSQDERDVVVEELTRLLLELELGRTRQQALLNLCERVRGQALREFVAAVVQADRKGNPLGEVLKIQAATLRRRRSSLAEEMAARAAVLMLLPLMMVFGCVLLIVLGPIAITSMQGGLL